MAYATTQIQDGWALEAAKARLKLSASAAIAIGAGIRSPNSFTHFRTSGALKKPVTKKPATDVTFPFLVPLPPGDSPHSGNSPLRRKSATRPNTNASFRIPKSAAGGGRRASHEIASAAGASYPSLLSPIKYTSTARAALRPSAIAQTTSDWPRRMSPAAKTPGMEDM